MTDREVIETLATKVLGLEILTETQWHRIGTRKWMDHGPAVKVEGKYLVRSNEGAYFRTRSWHSADIPFNPLESISDAWMLVEALRNRFRRIQVMAVSDKVADGMAAYCCQIEDGTSEVDEGHIAISDADSAPRAICLAALIAVNVEVAK